MLGYIRLVWLLLVSLVVCISGNSFFGTFISLRLGLDGVSSETIGAMTAVYYFGVFVASFFAVSWVRKLGHLRMWLILCALNGLLIALYAMWMNLFYWSILRFCSGLVIGAIFVVIESWFLLLAPSQKRSGCLAIYIIVYYAATTIGQLFFHSCDLCSLEPYLQAGFLSFLAIIPCVFRSVPVPQIVHSESFHFVQAFRSSFKGFFGGFISGILLACIYGLAPVYAYKIGKSVSEVGTMMAIIIFGGFFFQLPLGKLSDMWNRQKVMSWICFFAALFSLAVAWSDSCYWMQIFFLWMLGGFLFVIYPLSLAIACEKTESHQIVNITGGLNVTYGIGAIIGPIIAPFYMNWWGASGLFYFLGAVSLIMGLVVYDITKVLRVDRKSQPAEQKADDEQGMQQ